ncbi:hypothetical protein NQ036_09960 [Brevibacterium sp. 91QC2O2]|uniref:hypothetical protein n=1 Tax=Brevibacterium sp. 91QC2O2 TaxID=2968458 RepID=UPI00211CF9DF|nr:hypothetical protein [Brevibacterium sp. 91QC2O2]MCQ9368559.1 hypothetical protein [Brevibacterium sp. 91QC2O2]
MSSADEPKDWVQAWLSPGRWQRYLDHCAGDAGQALALYEWSVNLSGAVMHDVAHIEVGIRNVYDETLSYRWQGDEHWLFDALSPVNAPLLRSRGGRTVDLNSRNRTSISEATRRVRSSSPAMGQVIAELPFGFWRHLTDAAHEKVLWIPILSWAFPHRVDRKQVERKLTLINNVRNRASHHEQMFDPRRQAEVIKAQAAIIEVAEMLLPELAAHIRDTSIVDEVNKGKPA